jgi:hypothetical protein
LLSTTFGSSDIAKLYGVLCDVSGHPSAIKQERLKAA